MRKSVYETNYDRLVSLGIFDESRNSEGSRRSRSVGFMDLVVERLPHYDDSTGQKGKAYSLTHYFEQNGDLCKDPDMVIIVYLESKSVVAFSFEQSIPPIYQVVYPEPGKVYPLLKKELNNFLRMWLNNLIEQGHEITWG